MNTLKEVRMRADEIMSRMTLDEKIGQLNQVSYNGKNFDEVAEEIKARRVGSIILATSSQAGNDKQAKSDTDATDMLQKLAMENGGIPIIYGRDVIHGHRVVYPVPLAMAATFNPDIIEKSYREIAKEASRDGIHWSFAPMIDVSRDPRWGRCVEGPGEDPYLGGKMAEAAVRGFQGDDFSQPDSLAACVKHFVGYGASEGGRDYNCADIGETALRNFYLRAFDKAVKAGVATVMSSFNDISGIPLSANEHLLREVLKDEFGFDGFVVSDWSSVDMLIDFGTASDRKESAEQALKAGIDMDMVSKSYVDFTKELISEGKLSEDILDDAVRRILCVKIAFGLFENPYAPDIDVDYDKHIESAIEVAEQAVVLLKNKDSLLPLSRDAKISAIGPMINNKRDLLGTWTLDFNLDYVKTYKDVLNEEYSDVEVFYADSELQQSMVTASRKAKTAVVFLGEPAAATGENRSIANVDIPYEQAELVKKLHNTGSKVIAVLTFARPTGLEEIEPFCDAMIYAWHCGTGTAQAVVRTLFGDNVPSGALPMTLLRRSAQIPLYYNATRSGKKVDPYFGFAWWANIYEDMTGTPMYPFGYGLSYTEFKYSNIQLDKSVSYAELMNGGKLKVSVDVKNIGVYDGYETVQCYVKDEVAQIARPLRELKGFEKPFIKRGETKHIVFELGLDELGYYNAKSNFVADCGKFTIYIGNSSLATDCIEFVLAE